MTPEQISVQLAEPLGRQFDVPFREMIKDKVLYWSERMVRNTIDKDFRRRKQLVGMFSPLILHMEKVNNLPTGHPGNYRNWAESAGCIPAPLYANGIIFDYVGTVDGTTPFINSFSPTLDRFAQADKYISNVLRYSYLSNKIQVYRNPDISQIRMDYIPSNFRDYAIFNAAMCNTDCTWDNDEYPLPGDILQLVMQAVAAEIAKPAMPENHDKEEINIDSSK